MGLAIAESRYPETAREIARSTAMNFATEPLGVQSLEKAKKIGRRHTQRTKLPLPQTEQYAFSKTVADGQPYAYFGVVSRGCVSAVTSI